MKRLFLIFVCMFLRDGYKKAKFLKKSKCFKYFGNNVFWYPKVLPADMDRVEIHNNVVVATDVYFCTHDISHMVLNNHPNIIRENNESEFEWNTGKIVVQDNVFIGAKTCIKYGVEIGPNAIVAMGSVVTKNVPPNSVVGGNPARVIGAFEDFVDKNAKLDSVVFHYAEEN